MSYEAKLYLDQNGEIIEIVLPSQDFTIDTSALDQELCQMGQRMVYYGELEARLKTEVETKELQLERYEAEKDLAVRESAKIAGVKSTEATVSAEVKKDPTRILMSEDLIRSTRSYNVARWACRALLAKKDCLLAIAYRENALIKADRYSG